ncbi:phospholipase A and acyltransferase 4-like [Liolophura sinensis]|uniref:phospholipase A and acyltransferase 4-like n=1 Tax=Liolophura sinensis TaxID=3198878 RepID=UPI003158A4A5
MNAYISKKTDGDFVRVQRLQPFPGDLIEIDRGRYRHWVLYAGNGMVLHVTGLEREISVKWARVRLSDLESVSHGCLARVNNKIAEAKKRLLSPRNSDEVVGAVTKCVGAIVPYNILTRNCEHFVTEWKFGVAWSEQASLWNTLLIGGYISYNFLGCVIRRMRNSTSRYLRSYVYANEERAGS